MIKVKIVGAGGYGGVGLSELLLTHPSAKITALVDVENTGEPYSRMYPHLEGLLDNKICAPDSPEAQEPVDAVFMATPDRVGMQLAGRELENGAKVIDYSGDFRFNTAESYAEYAGRIGLETVHAAPDLLPEAVYGLAELHRKELNPNVRVVGNPGCFAVSCILGLAPAVASKIVNPRGIVCDCKTGVSGAGKKAAAVFHYPARYDQMNAYRLAGHQHVCEIERELWLQAGKDVTVTFTAQVVPAVRGILSTLYAELTKETTEEEVLNLYRDFYRDSPFVRIYPSSAAIGTMQVRGSNFCNLVVSVDSRNGKLRVVSHIDNLMKGQAGSALQNMNLICGLPETAGLTNPGRYP